MYGHVRTGAYCAPWIKKWFEVPENTPVVLHKQRILIDNEIATTEPCQVEVDYFLDLKDKNTSTNTIGDNPNVPATLNSQHLQEMLDLFQPKDYNITNFDNEFEWRTGNGLQNYASMFNSIYTCFRLKRQHEFKTGKVYDFCFAHRYDGINGPDINSFRNRLSTQGFPPLTIVSSFSGGQQFKRWPWENWRLGPNDVFFGGDNLAMEMLIADISKILFVNNNIFMSANEWGGPNVIIGRAINNASLQYEADMNFLTAIVRSRADLTRDVFDSWAYHQDYWVRNHSSNASTDLIQ